MCPPATQDLALNTKNRDATIKKYNYGPLNVDEPADYWEKIAKYWRKNVNIGVITCHRKRKINTIERRTLVCVLVKHVQHHFFAMITHTDRQHLLTS